MKIGTKSVLFGAHCFFLHPWFVAAAWWRLYGFPFDPRLWVAFFVHDLGYWGKPNMDGPEGEQHPYFGARIMQRLFDRKERKWKSIDPSREIPQHQVLEVWAGYRVQRAFYIQGEFYEIEPDGQPGSRLAFRPFWWRWVQTRWYTFTLYHSRFLAKREGFQYSRLCVADKLAIALMPAWLYLPMVNLTGEIREYMRDVARNSGGKYQVTNSQRIWYRGVREYVRAWVKVHQYGQTDEWTTVNRHSNETGVWQ